MADKSSFTPDEWNTLLGAPMLAGMAVTLAEPNGLWGMLKEGMAGARSLLDAKQDAGASPLIKALVADMETSEGRGHAKDAFKAQLTGKSAAELKPQVIAALAKIGALLDSKAPAEAVGFKTWLKHTAERVAEASSEGGFLGFGGIKVTDAEKASIADVAAALKI
jgi:hypothetical protein